MNTPKSRDYLFDNYKALLIFLVVVSHFIEQGYETNPFLYELKWFIVSFHMPAFIFVSGYFSKKHASMGKLIQKLVVPYLVYEVIYYLLYTLILHKETKLYLLYPKFSLWYLMALFFWRLITPYVRKIPAAVHMPFAILAGLLIGCSGMDDNFLSIPRILVFYPFFLAGIHFDRELLTRYRNRTTQFLAWGGISLGILFLCLDRLHHSISPKIFYGRYNYEYLEMNDMDGMCIRLLCYGISFAVTYLFMFIIPDRKIFCSCLGGRTMSIYLFHGLVYSSFKQATDLLENLNGWWQVWILLAFCIGIVWIFSRKPFVTFTNDVAQIEIHRGPKGPRTQKGTCSS